jgi:hypothetical protein
MRQMGYVPVWRLWPSVTILTIACRQTTEGTAAPPPFFRSHIFDPFVFSQHNTQNTTTDYKPIDTLTVL